MYELITKLLILSLIVSMMISYSYCVELCHLKGFLCLLGSFHIYMFIISKILYMCHVFMVDSLIISVEGKQRKRVFFNIKVCIINLNKKCNFNNLIPWCPTLNVFYLYICFTLPHLTLFLPITTITIHSFNMYPLKLPPNTKKDN